MVSMGLQAQDYQFSQYTDAPLMVNSAKTGYFKGEMRMMANYRQQWRSIAKPFKSYFVSADMPLHLRTMSEDDFVAGGFTMARHVAGESEFGYTKAEFHIAYWKALDKRNKQYLTVGASGGAGQRSINLANLTFGSQFNGVTYDPYLPHGEVVEETSFIYPDLGVGVIWYIIPSKYFNINFGAAVQHYNNPRLSLITEWDRLPEKYVFHTEMDVNFGRVSWQPSLLYLQQGEFSQIIAGNYLRFYLEYYQRPHPIVGPLAPVNAISFGAWYRLDDAVVLAARIEYEWMALGLSYDLNVSDLSASTNLRGGPEIFLAWIIHDWFDVGQNRKLGRQWFGR
jgi:type IX secretion system PorP/SprF family membrane protein